MHKLDGLAEEIDVEANLFSSDFWLIALSTPFQFLGVAKPISSIGVSLITVIQNVASLVTTSFMIPPPQTGKTCHVFRDTKLKRV